MAQSKNKTVPEGDDVDEFISAQPSDRQSDCRKLMNLMQKVTGEPAKMWGKSIVGFGQYHYVYDSGREGDFFHIGFSPRKQNLSIYLMAGFGQKDLMSKLGKFKTGKSCLYVKRLEDIDLNVLEELMKYSIKAINQKYPD